MLKLIVIFRVVWFLLNFVNILTYNI